MNNEALTERVENLYFGEVEAQVVSDYFGSERMDSAILIGDAHLVTVSGSEFEDFAAALNAVISDYRI